jgi:methionyl-tRNA formyltransferase
MKIILIGRTKVLLDSAKLLDLKGYQIVGIITSKASPDYKVKEVDFRNYAKKLNVPFLHDPKINTKTLQDHFGKTKPDIAISINYSGIISLDVINFFPHGVLNAHGGDLPKYRGNACQAWAIINGEDKIGLCIHKMIGGELDSGDILARNFLPINETTTIANVYSEFEILIPKMFHECLNLLKKTPKYILEKQSRNKEKALRCYPRKPQDGKIDWNNSAINIHRLVRASSEPYSGAYTYLDGEKVIIWKSQLLKDEENWIGIPGQFAEFDNQGFLNILTGKGKLKLIEVEYKNQTNKPKLFFKSMRNRFQQNKNDLI